MDQLVKSWIASKEYDGFSLDEAIRDLNEECGADASVSRLSEWGSGKDTPTAKIVSHMLFDTLSWAMGEAGILVTPEERGALDRLLWNFTKCCDSKINFFEPHPTLAHTQPGIVQTEGP